MFWLSLFKFRNNSSHPNGISLYLRLSLILLLISTGQTSLAGKSTRTEYYSISGSSAQQLINEMDRKGPQGFSGYTTNNYRYEYRTKMINGRCRVSHIRLDVDILYTMPRWENKASADPDLQNRWDSWYRALDRHERNHGAYAEKGYDDILKGWQGIGTSNNCQDIRNKVVQIYNSISARVKQENADYDRTTNHGRTEGASYNTLTGSNNSDTAISSNTEDANYWWLVFVALIGLLIYVRKT